MIRIVFKTVILVILTLFLSCSVTNRNQQLIIFHAGSLSVPFKQIAEAFEKEYPDAEILLEAAGSRESARKISELGKTCDIIASADYTVIEELLIPAHANWFLTFATNEMCIAYLPHSKAGQIINQENWMEILYKDSVLFGRSNPDLDPCGYRTVLTLKLAEKFYSKNGFTDSMLLKDVNYIRPKETDLLGLLESNTIDYIFIYRSVAEQHGLKYLILPDEINLKNPMFDEFYKSVHVEISGKNPGETIIKKGESMIYAATIINYAPNYKMALKFMDFLVDPDKGLKIMHENGQPPFVICPEKYQHSLPEEFKKIIIP